jgi:hypothetical protein
MAQDLFLLLDKVPGVVATHLRECLTAHQKEGWFAAAVWTAVVVEALLDSVADHYGIDQPSWDDLNGRITQLRAIAKNRQSAAPPIPDEIVRRCDEIRLTRNRLVHDTGLAKVTLRADATAMLAHLGVLLEWYADTIHRSKDHGGDPEPPVEAPAPAIRLFLSTNAPHTVRQTAFLGALKARLRRASIEPVQVTHDEYDKNNPLGKVKHELRKCDGLLAIGLERTNVYFCREKEGSHDQTEAVHRRYTSAWLDLEGGLAFGLDLPVFVLCEKSIAREGLFDRSWNNFTVIELDELDADAAQLDPLFRRLDVWREEKEARARPDQSR